MKRPRLAWLWPTAAMLIASAAAACSCAAAETYLGAVVDSGGDLRIQLAKGRDVVIKRDHEQAEFDKITISKEGASVGWLALYPNCCTSYPIPLKLNVYSSGHPRTFQGNDLPIWRWEFSAEGRQVAFEQETVHGGMGVHYELRDVATGRLIAEYDPPTEPEDARSATSVIPSWVARLDAQR